jgi:hypothetical protein
MDYISGLKIGNIPKKTRKIQKKSKKLQKILKIKIWSNKFK